MSLRNQILVGAALIALVAINPLAAKSPVVGPAHDLAAAGTPAAPAGASVSYGVRVAR